VRHGSQAFLSFQHAVKTVYYTCSENKPESHLLIVIRQEMYRKLKVDWVKFLLHFIFGLFLGLLGVVSWGLLFEARSWVDLLWLPVLLGILGGIFGDRLWEKFVKWL